MWHPCAAVLRREHRVIALDTIGDLGRSLPERLPRNAQGFTDWITEVMDELGIVRAHFVGLSYGAWLSANMAASCSDRVDRLVLLAPAAVFARISAGFLLRMMRGALVRSPRLNRSFREWMVHDPRALEDPADLIEVGSQARRLVLMPRPGCLSDDQLRSIRAATLFMIGEYEPVTRPSKAISRAERLVPEIETVLVPDAGHLLTGEAPERVNAKVSEFLSTTN
jgi:pimeloyl-ACP methyl ester carboxylesterase